MRIKTPDVTNALTVDVEDYYQVSAFENLISRGGLGPTAKSRRRKHAAITRDIRPGRSESDVFHTGLGGGEESGFDSCHRGSRP